MATIRICDNILEKDNLRTIFAKEGDFKTIRNAVESLAGNEAYAGKLVECYDPETDTTTWEPMCDDGTLSVSVFANGEEADIEYEIRDDDEILIFVLPAGGRNGAGFIGALIGAVIGVAFSIISAGSSAFAFGLYETLYVGVHNVTFGSILMGALAGGVAGYALATSIYDAINKPSSDTGKNLEGKSYPGVKGSKNQSILGKNYPFILGRHLMTPPYIVSPYSRSDGKFGEKQSIQLAYDAGYAPLRLTEFKLGDLLLAYNKTTESADRPTLMKGKFKRPTNEATPVYHWSDATEGEIRMLLASGSLVEKSETYEYAEYTGTGQYSTYKGMKQATRSWYESKNDNVKVSGITLYEKGTVQLRKPDLTEEEQDNSEILHRWINNDIDLEILQQDPDGEADWGTVVTQAIMQDEINATPLYVCDQLLGGVAAEYNVTYKGCLFDNGFRNNTVRFTRANPMKIEVELEATNGIYRTYQYSNDNHSETRYESIPCWYAIQWRPYGANYESGNAEDWRGDDKNPWRTFEHINRYEENGQTITPLSPQEYTQELHDADLAAHTGNKDITGASEHWVGCKLFNLGALIDNVGSGSADDRAKQRISMQRFTAVVDLSTLKDSLDTFPARRYGGAEYLRSNILNLGDVGEKGPNTNGTIQVRVIRVSPCYLNETKGSNDGHYSAKQYCDVVKWNSLTTFTFDDEELKKADGYSVQAEKITTESELRKLCIVALKAKADTGGNIQSQLGKLNFIAESFSPTFAEKDIGGGVKQVVIQPENISKQTVYYKPAQVDRENNKVCNYDTDNPITEEQYEEFRQNNIPAIKRKLGNNYTETILREIFSTPPDADGRRVLAREIKDKYVDNNAASSALLALLGKQNGIDALGYEDLNLDSFAEMYQFCKSVYDGSTYPSDEVVFNDDMSSERYRAGDEVRIKYSCNACVTNAIKVETLLQKCLATGRAICFRDENNKIKVAVDKKRDNPVMLINQQNVISGSNTISYEALPAGLQFNFEDETDGFTGHTLYAMNDGEDYRNPTKEIESYSIDFVTNRHQLWSLGRYVMASRNMQRESLARKVGPEGFCAEIGDLVKVSDDTILIGTDLGARVKELIEDSSYIYGIVTDETWKYTGKTETVDENGNAVEERSVQGAELLQPTKYKQARVVTYRCALPGTQVSLWRVAIDGNIYSTNGTITIDGVQYTWIDNSVEQKYFDGHYYERYFDLRDPSERDGEPEDGDIIPAYQKTYKMVPGETNVMLFDKAVAKSGEYAGMKRGEENLPEAQLTYYKPELDDIVAFGNVGKVTSLYVVMKIKPDKDFNFDLSLAQYSDQVYCAGEAMPQFDANMTIPDRSGEDNFPLSEALTPAESQTLVNSNVQLAIKTLSTGEADIDEPDTPSISVCKAERDGISLECAPLGGGAKNSVGTVHWQVAKAQAVPASSIPEEAWTAFREGSQTTETHGLSAYYEFDRAADKDGFPEGENPAPQGWHGVPYLNDIGSKWYFRVKVTNSYGKDSAWSAPKDVDISEYGTWLVDSPDMVTDRVSGRTATMAFNQRNAAQERPLYGDVYYKIEIKRLDSRSNDWFVPAESEDPYESVDNYKYRGSEATPVPVPNMDWTETDWKNYLLSGKRTTHSFTQTLPLAGQNDQLYQYQWHYERFPVGDNDPYARLDSFGQPRKEGSGTSFSAAPPSADWDSVSKVFGDKEDSEHNLPGYFSESGRSGDPWVHGTIGETGDDSYPTDVFRYGKKEEVYELIKDNGTDYSRAFHNGVYVEVVNNVFTLDGITWTIANGKVTNDADAEEDDIFIATKFIKYDLVDGINPIDTAYQYRIRAFNVWGERVVHYSGAVIFTVTALATSAKDVVEGAITHNKLAEGAVWVDNLAAGSITADKMAVKDLMAITGVFGRIQNNIIETQAHNKWNLETGEFHIGNQESIIDPDSDEAEFVDFNPTLGKLTIKIANFIVKAITSIINSLFVITNRDGGTKNNVLAVNPELTSKTTEAPAKQESVDALTARVNGNLEVKATTVYDRNNNPVTKSGDLTVDGTIRGTLGHCVRIKQTLDGQTVTDTFDGSADKEITIRGYNQSLNKADDVQFDDITATGGISATGDIGTVNGTVSGMDLSISNSAQISQSITVGGDATISGGATVSGVLKTVEGLKTKSYISSYSPTEILPTNNGAMIVIITSGYYGDVGGVYLITGFTEKRYGIGAHTAWRVGETRLVKLYENTGVCSAAVTTKSSPSAPEGETYSSVTITPNRADSYYQYTLKLV